MLRILFTNSALADRGGSELYLLDAAVALRRRGHTPVAYSTVLGEVADELRKAGVPVTDDLGTLAVPPDLIHGHHHLETLTALLHFPGVPAVYVYHGRPWEESPPSFPRIRRYLAVSRSLRDRLVLEHGVPADCVRLLPNFVDLRRFAPRGPLPVRPARALVFSNYVSETAFRLIRDGCGRLGVTVNGLGVQLGGLCPDPERLLRDYDVVFAMGRSALEALAVGAAVIVCDHSRLGPMVTAAALDQLREDNLGPGVTSLPLTADAVQRELARYEAGDAMEVARRVRASVGLEAAVDELCRTYEEVRLAHRAMPVTPARAELVAAAAYVRWLAPRLKANEALVARRAAVEAERDSALAECRRLESVFAEARRDRATLAAGHEALAHELTTLCATATFRLREAVLRRPALRRLARSAARCVSRWLAGG